ncbi:HNH endonuclease [Pseudomonas sp. GV071]|uniref:HNH endonuclease n=1 Tax=Pseudomonas sp. GV071 TaxID=2135754 RepID=UPI000D3D5864|nr:HNH endonuclease [Pseudomonas sp. GV071]PTQ71100.1 HNH endonuclease [Pseudomonas sp. GV071]
MAIDGDSQFHAARANANQAQYWWVNHKQTYKAELEGGYIWSPMENQGGARNQTYLNLKLVSPGDIIVSYAGAEIRAIGVAKVLYQEKPKPEAFGRNGQNWSESGWLVPVEWTVLSKPVSPKQNLADIVDYLPSKHSPLQRNGNGNQGCYLASISSKLGSIVLGLAADSDNAVVDRIKELEDQLKDDLTEHGIQENKSLSLTEREQLIRARVGQGAFRLHVKLIERSCRLTGVSDDRFLVASHIKPWKDCENAERLDGNNGLLLSPHVDKLFDRGWISFSDEGKVLIARNCPRELIAAWRVDEKLNVGEFSAQQRVYLSYHRDVVFQG